MNATGETRMEVMTTGFSQSPQKRALADPARSPWNYMKLTRKQFTMFRLPRICNRFLAGCFLVLFSAHVGSFLFAEASPEFDEIRKSYYESRTELLAASEARFKEPEKDSKFRESLNRIWSIIGKWTAAYLNSGPTGVAPAELARHIESLDPAGDCAKTDYKCWEEYHLSATAISLKQGPDSAHAVSVSYPRMGTFFIVARDASGYQVRWSVKDVAEKHYPSKDELGYWAYADFAYGDGPLVGRVNFLPPSFTGNPRFYVNAFAASKIGGTSPRQISIWEWNGKEALPLLIKTYSASFDTGSVRLQNDLLLIPTKDNYKTFFSCGGCPEAKVLWTIRVSPAGIEDLGKKHVVPELQAVDELWYRLINNLSATGIASKKVIARTKQLIQTMKAEATEPTDYTSLSMLGSWKIIKQGTRERLCFSADNLICKRLLFDIRPGGGNPYFSALRVVDDCQTSCNHETP
jgi:hypothetical protein